MLFTPSDNSIMFDNIHPAGQAVLHLHRLHHSALLAVSNLFRPCNVYFMWCVSPSTLIYNFQRNIQFLGPDPQQQQWPTSRRRAWGSGWFEMYQLAPLKGEKLRGFLLVDASPWQAWLVAGLQLRREEQTHSTLFPYTLCKINWDLRRERRKHQGKQSSTEAMP